MSRMIYLLKLLTAVLIVFSINVPLGKSQEAALAQLSPSGSNISGRITDSNGRGLYAVQVTASSVIVLKLVYLPAVNKDSTLAGNMTILGAKLDPFSADANAPTVQQPAQPTYNYTTWTNEDGYYYLNVVDGRYKISVLGEYFYPLQRELDVPPDATDQSFEMYADIPEGMVYVAAGEFVMGCDSYNNNSLPCPDHELPAHWVFLDAFYIDENEVTNAQYAGCVAAGACTKPVYDSSYSRADYYNNPLYDDYPVIKVMWDYAEDYCAWRGGRLPTEAEWEKAVRGITVKAFPWGNAAPTCEFANANLCTLDTTTVGSYKLDASVYGAMDMAGNVMEWVSDWFGHDYYSSATYFDNPTGPETGSEKVARGGSFINSWNFSRTAFRIGYSPNLAAYNIGIRCAAPIGK